MLPGTLHLDERNFDIVQIALCLQFVKQLLDKDNTVIAAVRNPQAEQLQELTAANPKCIALAVDVADVSSIQKWASAVAEVSPAVDVRCHLLQIIFLGSHCSSAVGSDCSPAAYSSMHKTST